MSSKAITYALCALATLVLYPSLLASAQNLKTTEIEGVTHKEHKFIQAHELGKVGEPFPQVNIYSKTGKHGLMMLKMIIALRNDQPCCSETTIPKLILDGMVYNATAVTYEQFPLNEGYEETFRFYIASNILHKLVDSQDVTIDINGQMFQYPAALRRDYAELFPYITAPAAEPVGDMEYEVK